MPNPRKPQQLFFEDDETFPNSKFPVLMYENVFEERGKKAAVWLEDCFTKNSWANTWRNGIYPYHHYHSTSHEVLGVYSGSAPLQLGGKKGDQFDIFAGDILVIPAGVAHKNLGATDNFGVVGAYPNGMSYDTKKGREGEYAEAKKNIANVSVPSEDPVLGMDGALPEIWGEILRNNNKNS